MRPMFSSSVVAKIERAVQEVGGTTDTKEDLAFVTLQSKQCINSWKLDVIDELDETSVLLVLDWAKKYLPKKFRESQTDRFGKRGLPWHITVATRKGNDGKIEMMTFVHLFETCNQDSSAVLAILNDVFRRLKDVMPYLSQTRQRRVLPLRFNPDYSQQSSRTKQSLPTQNGFFRSPRREGILRSESCNDQIPYGHPFEFRPRYRVGISIIWGCPWSKSSVMQASFVFYQKATEMGWCELCQQRSVWRGRCESMEILQNWKKQIHSLEQVSCS